MNEGIVYNLTQCGFWNFQWLRAFHPFIPDIGNQILGPKDFHNPVGHSNDVTLNDVLEKEVRLIADETADAEVNAVHEILWMGAKKDDGCDSQIAGFRDEMQVLENSEGIIFQGICREAFLLDGILQEIVNGFPVDILFNRGIWNFHFVPAQWAGAVGKTSGQATSVKKLREIHLEP